MTTPLFNVSGLASGLDTDSMITQLMNAERMPVQQLQVRKAQYDVKQAAWGEVTTRVSAVRTAVNALRNQSDFGSFVTANSSNQDAVTVTAGTGAKPQTVDFTVSALASSHQLRSGTFASGSSAVGAGTFTISRAGADHAFTTTASTTLDQLAAQINADSTVGVTASVLKVTTGDSRLILTASDTGTANQFTAVGTQAQLAATVVNRQATDATLEMGGLTITRSSNVITDLLAGTTLTLKATTAAPVSITTGRDTDKAVAAVKSLVDSVNKAISQIQDFTKYDAETKTAGQLQGDASARSLTGDLTRALSSVVEGLGGTYTSATSVGLSVQRDGTYKLDETKLKAAFDKDFQGVVNLFARTGSGADARVSFVTSGPDTKVGSYAVQLTQAGSAPGITGSAYSTPGADETFSIQVGTKTASVTLGAGDSLTTAVAKINASLSTAGVTTLMASADSGALRIASVEYGSGASFTVSGASAFALDGTFTGTDAAGTIDGVAATGVGQTLTSKNGNSKGLSVRVAASQSEINAAGGTLALGSLSFTEGIAGRLSTFLDRVEGSAGTIETAKARYENQEKLVDERITAYNARLEIREATLRRQFTAMETALSQLQGQGSFLGSVAAQ